MWSGEPKGWNGAKPTEHVRIWDELLGERCGGRAERKLLGRDSEQAAETDLSEGTGGMRDLPERARGAGELCAIGRVSCRRWSRSDVGHQKQPFAGYFMR